MSDSLTNLEPPYIEGPIVRVELVHQESIKLIPVDHSITVGCQ